MSTRSQWVLRVAALLQCVGLFRIAFIDGTPLGTTLFMSLRWSESSMLAAEHGVAWVGLFAGLSLLMRPTRLAALAVALWFFEVAVLTVVQGGSFGAEYALFAHATRYGLGIALFLTALPNAISRARRIEQVLRWAAAITFVAHGLEAIAANPRFIDYIITAGRRIGVEISEDATRMMLRLIGIQDLVLAGLIVARRWRWVAGYMAFWGLITAGSRVVHMGTVKWPAMLVRAANGAVPLALFFLWSEQRLSDLARDRRGSDE